MQNWKPLQEVSDVTLTYSSADAPVFVASTSGDLTGSISLGMRLRISQSTGGTKYFIVVAITNSTITIYGGTDYTLNNEAISDPVFSSDKVPFGFTLDPNKWSVIFTDTSDRNQSSPTANTWYNPGSLSLVVPIGAWNLSYKAVPQMNITNANIDMYITLSTANNSESDSEFTQYQVFGSLAGFMGVPAFASKPVTLASKTTYYINVKTAAAASLIGVDGGEAKTVIRAVCAYL
jgi:hypothetical protein